MAATLNVTSRNLTDVFVLMRNNSLQNKHIFSDQVLDDKVALVSSRELDSGPNFSRSVEVPPEWVEGIEDVQYEMSRIKQKLQELNALHEKHITRPSLDDVVQEEKDIEAATQDVTRMFLHCKKIINQIRERSRGTTSRDHEVSQNVVSSLVSSLQELSASFHTSQSYHLKRLQSREERSQLFFDTTFPEQSNDFSTLDSLQEDSYNQAFLNSSQQQVFVEDNTLMVEQREREIKQIVRSMAELNDIFRDLASMVTDQGTVLDRIDYNLEKVQTQVHQGLQQLRQADNYRRKNRKMVCILVLSATVILLIILLVVFKS